MINPLNQLFAYSKFSRRRVGTDLPTAANQLAASLGEKPLLVLLGGLSESAMVGTVSEHDVRLHRITPFFGNVFKPFFVGAFEVRDRVVYLEGEFKMGILAKISVWSILILGFAAQLTALTHFDNQKGIDNIKLLEPMLFILAGLLVAILGKMVARSHVTWLESRIEDAFPKP